MARQASEYQAVVAALLDLLVHGKALDDSLDRHDASPLARQISYGATREYFLLTAILEQLLDKPLPKKHADIRMLLLAGIYSVRHLHRPEYASVDRVVEAAKAQHKPWARGLVNGVLRNFVRGRAKLEQQASSKPEAATLHPAWLAARIEQAWPDRAESVIAANNSRAPMTLRINRYLTTVPDYLQRLQTAGIDATAGSLSEAAVVLAEPRSVDDLPGFTEGLASVQDEASQLAATLLELAPGQRVLDACAAPGSKSCHMLEVEPGIQLTCVDADAGRCQQINANLHRLNLDAIVIAEDLLQFSPHSLFDRILLDVPCSAIGVIRRHPDIKLLRREADIDKLAATQLALLDKAWRLLGEDGILLYSTCSVLPQENDAVIETFADARGNVEMMPLSATWGTATNRGRQLLPEVAGCDGFFYAKIKKMRSD